MHQNVSFLVKVDQFNNLDMHIISLNKVTLIAIQILSSCIIIEVNISEVGNTDYQYKFSVLFHTLNTLCKNSIIL